MPEIPVDRSTLIVTSPPYNISKPYETRSALDTYVDFQTAVINECFRVLGNRGSICWQVGNWVDAAEIIPLDSLVIPIFRRLGMKIRGGVVWRFGHSQSSWRIETASSYAGSEKVALSPSIEDLFTVKPWLEGRPEDTAIPIQTVTP
nr:DNA methyltransferase [Rhizobium leguminosarum]